MSAPEPHPSDSHSLALECLEHFNPPLRTINNINILVSRTLIDSVKLC